MNLKQFTAIADKAKEKFGKSSHVAISYWAFSHCEGTQLRYTLYIDRKISKEFTTTQELKQAVENLLNPPVDEGIWGEIDNEKN